MSNYETFADIHKRLIESVVMGSTPEGRLCIGVVAQRISDAMGLDGSDEKVLLPADGPQGVARYYKRRKLVTQQEIAKQWFRDKEHYPWCDDVDLEPTWINWILKNKCGVTL